MSFLIKIEAQETAAPVIRNVTTELGKTEDAADQATASLAKLGTAGTQAGQQVAAGMRDAGSTVGATGETFGAFFDRLDRDQARVLQRIKGPWETYKSDLQAAATLAQDGKISLGEYEGELGRLASRLESIEHFNLAPQLRLQADMYEAITGPLQRYEKELGALDALLKAEQITLEQYDAQLAKVQRRAESSGAIAPVQGPAHDPAQAGYNEELQREASIVERLQRPMSEYAQTLTTLNSLQQKGKISLDDYNRELDKAKNTAGFKTGISDELKRETTLLEQLAAPMKRYEQDLTTLVSLHNKGKISIGEYDQELAKLNNRAKSSGAFASLQGKSPVPGVAASQGDQGDNRLGEVAQAIGPQFGAAGNALAGFATSGTVATGALVALVAEVVHLGDEYIVLANKAQKVTDKGDDVNKTLEQQFDLSKRLHGSLETTLELYDSVRDGTDELNISRTRQIGLTREIGQAVLAEGKSLEAAEGLMNRLTFAFANGSIAGRDMRSIMKSFPDIGAAFVETLGHSRQELIAMANKGQISAEMLLDAFHKINKEMAEKSDKQMETSSQRWQHFKDQTTLDAKLIGDKAATALEVVVGAGFDQAKAVTGVLAAAWDGAFGDHRTKVANDITQAIKRSNEELRVQKELLVLIKGEQERNAKTASMADISKTLGIEFAPFDEELANKAGAARQQMSQIGIEIGDVFEAAHGKAQLFGKKLAEIQERKDAEKIAEDVKRIYNALHGADDLLEDQAKRWQKVGDEVRTTSEAVLKLQAMRFVSGAPQSQDERDLILKGQNDKTEIANAQYGKQIIGYAQGLNTAKAELEAFNRAQKDGLISGEAARSKYDQLMTTLNDGRLPEAIKIWEGLNLPLQQAGRDFAALNALLRSGRIDVFDYNEELKKIADTHKSSEAVLMTDAIARLHQQMDHGILTLGEYEVAVKKLTQGFGELRKTSSGVSYRIAPPTELDVSHGLLPNTYKPFTTPGVTENPELKQLLVQVQSAPQLTPGASDEITRLNERLEGANKLAGEFYAPAVKYENALKTIDLAAHSAGLTEDQATILRRKARDTLNQETEALEAQKGPMEAYTATLKKLKDQLDAGDISADKYADGLDKAKVAMLQATGAANTFQGAMQIEWIKMQQEADNFGATIANLAVNDFGKLNDAIVAVANGGAVSWTQMADSMIQDLERIALKMAEVGLVKGAIAAFASSGGDSTMDAGLVDEFAAGMGYATGGSFTVGGNGGIDTTPVMFRATPGERVTITTPGAYPHSSPGGGGAPGTAAPSGGAPVINVHNHYDSSMVTAAIASPEGQTTVLNVMRANASAIRAALGVR